MKNRIGWFGGIRCLTFVQFPEIDVRIHTGILECVCFLGRHVSREGKLDFEVAGTGFFIAVGDHRRMRDAMYYLVTAKHIALAGDDLFARVNRKDGGYEFVALRDLDAKWMKSEDADVAAIMFALQGDRDDHLEYTLLHQEEFATDEWLKEKHIEPSDEIAVTGLFIPHEGRGQNRPIIRGGMIAAMPNPEEPVTAVSPTITITAPAYLLEMHSSGGLSGSPVLVMTESHRRADGSIANRNEGTKLLGLIGGHWHLPIQFPMDRMTREQFTELNRGIAIGVPIQELSKLLDREDAVSERETRRAASRHKHTATLDSALDEDIIADAGPARGPQPERLKIDEPMDAAVKRMFERGKPSEGEV